MINLKKNQTALFNVASVAHAIRCLNRLIKTAEIASAAADVVNVNLDYNTILPILKSQRQKLVDYLATIGIDASDYTDEIKG